MKLLDLIRLNEIGNRVKLPKNYDKSESSKDFEAVYNFNVDGAEGEYKMIIRLEDNSLFVSFSFGEDTNFGMANKNVALKTMSNVVALVNQYLEDLESKNINATIEKIVFDSSEEFEGDDRRTRLYSIFIKKQLSKRNIKVKVTNHGPITICELTPPLKLGE